MKIIADFHLHSKYSRATSHDMDVDHLNQWARLKGIHILGTGDFTHPLWLKELKEKLEPAEQGLYCLKGNQQNNLLPRFILTSEISCIYSKNNRVRKIHILVFAPSFDVVEKINTQLSWIGNLKADGRPILGLDAKELAKIVLNISDQCLIVPAHVMTPWFGIFGSKSGFNSLAECFDEYAQYIYGLETGLSADPPMLWRIPDGREKTLISNSDAHSPSRIGREANVFEINDRDSLNYQQVVKIIKTRQGFLKTVEFFPQEGKYHYDGHRNCGISFSPEETKNHKGICPKCGRPLTIGVLNRIEELADKSADQEVSGVIPFIHLVPLEEIIADALGVGVASKAVAQQYNQLIERLNNEFYILLEAGQEEISYVSSPEIAEGVIRVRQGNVKVKPGFDGEYGQIKIFGSDELKSINKQGSLFD